MYFLEKNFRKKIMIFFRKFHAMAAGCCLRAEAEAGSASSVQRSTFCALCVTYVGRFFYEFILLIQEMSPHIKILQKFRVEPILVASEEGALRAILDDFSAKSEILEKSLKESCRKYSILKKSQ